MNVAKGFLWNRVHSSVFYYYCCMKSLFLTTICATLLYACGNNPTKEEIQEAKLDSLKTVAQPNTDKLIGRWKLIHVDTEVKGMWQRTTTMFTFNDDATGLYSDAIFSKWNTHKDTTIEEYEIPFKWQTVKTNGDTTLIDLQFGSGKILRNTDDGLVARLMMETFGNKKPLQ